MIIIIMMQLEKPPLSYPFLMLGPLYAVFARKCTIKLMTILKLCLHLAVQSFCVHKSPVIAYGSLLERNGGFVTSAFTNLGAYACWEYANGVKLLIL